jgi:hypothetical protein
MAYVDASKASVRKGVRVRIPLPAQLVAPGKTVFGVCENAFIQVRCRGVSSRQRRFPGAVPATPGRSTFRDIAAAIGRGTGVPTASIAAADAGDHFSFLGAFVSLDNPTSSELTRKTLNWDPAHPGLIEDLDHGPYFDQD